jgi:hypothetical protein
VLKQLWVIVRINCLFWNAIFLYFSIMSISVTPLLEQALKAFTYHQPVSLTKKNGERIGEGYILIMYGDVAFRMQDASPGRNSHFVSLCDIAEISVHEPGSHLS